MKENGKIIYGMEMEFILQIKENMKEFLKMDF